MRHAACILFVVVFLGRCSASDPGKEREGEELMAKAAAAQNLRSLEARPFSLHMSVHAERIVTAPTDGTYDEVWVSPEKWRRKIAFIGFDQTEVGDANSEWMSRSLDFRPRLVTLMESAIFPKFDLQPKEAVASVHTKKKSDISVRCVSLRGEHGQSRELCFDPSGALAVEEKGERRIEFSDYAKFGGKIYPRSIRVYYKGKEVVTVHMGDPTSISDPGESTFSHSAGALQLATCERSNGDLVKKVAPQYPQDARNKGVQGTVVLYVLLSGEGRVENARVVESAGESLDRAATEAVQQWEYRAVSCGKTPLPTEIEVQINFTLQGF